MHGWEISVIGRTLGRILNVLTGRQKELNRERPEVFLKIRHRASATDDWRAANFSIRNQINHQLVVKEITLGWGSWGSRVAPARVDDDIWTMDKKKIGRTFELDQILRPNSGETLRQTVPFYLRHPRDLLDKGRHTLKIAILIEQRTDPKKHWWTTIEGQIPQQQGDPVLFSKGGPLQ